MSKRSLKTTAKVPSLGSLAVYTSLQRIFVINPHLDTLTSSALCPVLSTTLRPTLNLTTPMKSSSDRIATFQF